MSQRRRSLSPLSRNPPGLKKNSVGGIAVDESELRAAFEFFDVSGKGKITLHDLKNRLGTYFLPYIYIFIFACPLLTKPPTHTPGAFYKNVPLREYKFLMNNQSELSLDDLRSLLENNEIKNFDPVAEAFKVYDPQETGYVDTNVLKGIFEKLGFGTITKEDIQILVDTADIDKDGKISLEDFRNMINENNQK